MSRFTSRDWRHSYDLSSFVKVGFLLITHNLDYRGSFHGITVPISTFMGKRFALAGRSGRSKRGKIPSGAFAFATGGKRRGAGSQETPKGEKKK